MADPLPLVVSTNRLPDDVLGQLAGKAQIVQGSAGDLMPRHEVMRLLPKAAAIINQGELRVDAELLAAAPNLRVVAQVALGTDNLDLPLLTARGVWATNAGDSFTESTADCALALLLGVSRRLVEADRYVRSGQWRSFQPGAWDGMMLKGHTLGIIGYGRIGRAVGRRAAAFGLHPVHWNRTESADAGYRPLPALLSEADVVCLTLPLNAESRAMFDADRFAAMKPGAILINVARGRIVVEAALVAALQSGQLAGAGLDVFEDEPAVHPALLGMKNVVLLPHIGGGTVESRRAARLLAVANVLAVLEGQTPPTPVNQPQLA